jgi:hypothetical protein
LEGFLFFQFALGWHYGFGKHIPGRTSLWNEFQRARPKTQIPPPEIIGIHTPESVRAHIRRLADAGIDQIAFIQQCGRNQHAHVCEAMELFAGEVMPEFKEMEALRLQEKEAELRPYIVEAFKRKRFMAAPDDAEIPPVIAGGHQIVDRSRADAQAPAASERVAARRL